MTVSSLAGGFATNPAMLLTARVLQGFATAIATPAALALLITEFRDEKQRARVLGLNGALLSAEFTVGALAGGTLVGVLSWRWAFLVTVTLGLLAVVVGILDGNPVALLGGVALLVVFWLVEQRARAPLAAVDVLSRPAVKWAPTPASSCSRRSPGSST